MKYKNYSKILFTVLAMAFALGNFACQNSPAVNSSPSNTAATANSKNPVSNKKPPTLTDVPVGNAQSPSEAYRMLFAAVKSQDTAKIRSMYSKRSIGLAEMQATQSNQPLEKVFENGFSETTFADNYPQMRDERIKENFGAVEVWNESRKQWDDLPFILEDGSWKLAVGDAFAGTFKSPGKGQAVIEQENANASSPNKMIQQTPNANVSSNFTNPKKLDKNKIK